MEQQPEKKPEQKMQQAPELQREKAKKRTEYQLEPGQKQKFWLSALTIAAIAFGGWSLMPSASPDKDYVTNETKTEIASEFNAVNAYPVSRVTNPEEITQAILSMGLAPEKQKELENKVANNDLDMVWIQAWDNMAEDGDALRFESATYQVTTTIMNKPVVFALPLTKGINHVQVTGIHDGGGGITASVITSVGAVSPPVIEEGQSYTLPLK